MWASKNMELSPESLNAEPLRSWIQPQHLETERLLEHQRTFSAHPSRLIHLKDFLLADVADRLSKFLSQEAIFRAEFGVYSSEEAVPEERFGAAPDADRFFRMRRMMGTHPQFMMSPNALTYVRFRQLFQRPALKAFFEVISNLPLGTSDDFGSHLMSEGDFLKPHNDNNRNRRLALVFYLTQGWEPRLGGNLHVVAPDGQRDEIVPEYNSVVAFDVLVNVEHQVSTIINGKRFSIGGWYHKEIAPPAS
jgi:2OG-Fe(II) oxygenase superfamily